MEVVWRVFVWESRLGLGPCGLVRLASWHFEPVGAGSLDRFRLRDQGPRYAGTNFGDGGTRVRGSLLRGFA